MDTGGEGVAGSTGDGISSGAWVGVLLVLEEEPVVLGEL